MADPVLTGVDVLENGGFKRIRGKTVGLITNHTGLNSDGKATVDVLHSAAEVRLKALFGPEHGIRGVADAPVPDGKDVSTGLPVFSLYGDRHTPTDEQLAGLDVLVYDIQDVGSRFYTYSSTLGLCLEAAARRGLPFLLLDRPNPLGGIRMEGPLADVDGLSFVAHHTIPIRHALTMGEYALLLNGEKSLRADLTVIRAQGWNRADLWDATGLTWTNPSPNMRSLTQALLYPGICLLEYTNLSVGRGCDTPFEVFGAPWLHARRVCAGLNDSGLPGVRFIPVHFTPASSAFEGLYCQGVNVVIVDRARFLPVLTGITIIEVLLREHRSEWHPASINRLLVNRSGFSRLMDGESARHVVRSWVHDIETFETRRRPYLIY